jgi:hypothetical protein
MNGATGVVCPQTAEGASYGLPELCHHIEHRGAVTYEP